MCRSKWISSEHVKHERTAVSAMVTVQRKPNGHRLVVRLLLTNDHCSRAVAHPTVPPRRADEVGELHGIAGPPVAGAVGHDAVGAEGLDHIYRTFGRAFRDGIERHARLKRRFR